MAEQGEREQTRIPTMRVELEVSFEAGNKPEDATRWAAQVKGILERGFMVPRDVCVSLVFPKSEAAPSLEDRQTYGCEGCNAIGQEKHSPNCPTLAEEGEVTAPSEFDKVLDLHAELKRRDEDRYNLPSGEVTPQTFEEWWKDYISGRSIDPFPTESVLVNVRQAAWSAWNAASRAALEGEFRAACVEAIAALRSSYNVQDSPADGDTRQDHAANKLGRLLGQSKDVWGTE